MTATAVTPDEDTLTALEEGLDAPRVCEHPHHLENQGTHDDGPATHWAMTRHECFGPVGIPYPVCAAYAAYLAVPDAERIIRCSWCNENVGHDAVWTIGRIHA
jgi:hypothetical protein